MGFLPLLRTCFRSIFRNRMRSFLTALGIIIGVGSVIIMVGVGQGTQKNIEAQIAAMGTNLLQVSASSGAMRPGQTQMSRAVRLTRSDLNKLKAESSYVSAISGVVQSNASITGNGTTMTQVPVYGVDYSYLHVRDWEIGEGTFFGDEDSVDRNRVAVLGATVAEELFSETGALDQQIRIGVNTFTVIGVLKARGSSGMGSSSDDLILAPLETVMTRILNTSNVSSIVMKVVDPAYMTAAQNETDAILREAHGLSATATADFSIMNSADMLETASSITGMLTMLLAAIAGVSLLVGGIGIMNIMLVSVTERTREIGIRMAVGGRKRDILFQFLSESIILSVMGGLLGVAMAFGVCNLLTRLLQLPTAIPTVLVIGATGFAAFIGIIFGYGPASKAAKLYPIDALRYE